MHSGNDGRIPTSQPKPASENSANSCPTQSQGNKRERGGCVSLHCKNESNFKHEIEQITNKGGGVNLEGVDKLVQLMQQSERKMDLGISFMFANVLASTDNLDCLNRFLLLKGLPVLNTWLQDIHKRRIGDESVEQFLLVLLRALDKLPVNLQALQMCNIGRSVNRLRSHKNTEIQRKARILVDTWKKRVEAEMMSIDAKSSSTQNSHDLKDDHKSSPTGSVIVNKIKFHASSFGPMNALIESCIKCSEGILSEDDAGMNLLASVAVGETSSDLVSACDSMKHEAQVDELIESRSGSIELDETGKMMFNLNDDDDDGESINLSTDVQTIKLNASTTKNHNLPLDFDLNVADERVVEETASVESRYSATFLNNNTSDSTPIRGFGGLDLDLNTVDETNDTDKEADVKQHMHRDFDLNDDPKLSIKDGGVAYSGLPINNPGPSSYWFSPGNTYSTIPIPSVLHPFPIFPPNATHKPFDVSMYHESVLSSSPAVPYPSSAFQFPVFPYPFSASYLVNSNNSRQGLDLNSGLGPGQHSIGSFQALAEEQARMFSVSGGVLKRREPETH